MIAHGPGDLLDDRYRLIERIGSGGMATVYLAQDTRLDRPVAVKLLLEGQDVDDVTRARLRAEAQFAGSLQHPGIVQVYDYGEEPDGAGVVPYLVMQYVEGTPLSEVLREQGALPAETVAAVLADVADALTASHAAGIVHRDLKPSNIQMTDEGRAVLVDFGVARSDSAEPLTQTGLVIGTVDYISPEQIQGRLATPASDVYALGVVAYHCLTAVSPFRRDTPAATALARLQEDAPELSATIPGPLRTLVRRMLAREPEDRPTAAEVADLAAAARDEPTRMMPPMPPAMAAPSPPPWFARFAVRRWDGRRKVAVAAAAAIVLGIVAVVVGQGDDATPPAGATEQVVPAVKGDRVADAVRALRQAGFEAVRVPVDGPARPGRVLSQSPGPGPLEGTDTTVTLRVSSGWVEVDEKALLGTKYDVAARTLAELHLRADRAERPADGAAGTVVGVDPEGRVRVGSTVTLVVATAVAEDPGGKSKGHGEGKHGKGHGKGGGDKRH